MFTGKAWSGYSEVLKTEMNGDEKVRKKMFRSCTQDFK